VPTGLDAAQTEFDALAETGGSKTGLQSHNHTLASHIHNGPSHNHSFAAQALTSNNTTPPTHTHILNSKVRTTNTAHAHDMDFAQYSVAATGSGASFGTSNHSTDTNSGTIAHEHTIGSHGHAFVSDGGGATSGPNVGDTSSSGTGSGNLVPYVVLNYIIKF
jgi:hypothetical protein